jgi:hypothetical protein
VSKHDVDPNFEQAVREDARHIEDEVMADPEGAHLSEADYAHAYRPNRRRQLFTLRLSDGEYGAIQQAAAERHLPASTLARAWLLDRLTSEQRAS